MNKSKVIIGWFLIILMAFICLAAGTATGSFFVPEGSGMSGPVTALGYGFVGLLIALVAGSLMAKKLPFEILRVALYNSNRGFIGVWFYNLSNKCTATK